MKVFMWFMIIVCLIASFGAIVSSVILHKNILLDAEWRCIAERCTNEVSGEDWVNHFCKLRNGTIICEVDYQGQKLELPLENIKVDEVKGCIAYECASSILLRNGEVK